MFYSETYSIDILLPLMRHHQHCYHFIKYKSQLKYDNCQKCSKYLQYNCGIQCEQLKINNHGQNSSNQAAHKHYLVTKLAGCHPTWLATRMYKPRKNMISLS